MVGLDLCFVEEGRQCVSSKGCVVESVDEWEDFLPLHMVASLGKGDTDLVGENDTEVAAPNKCAVESV